MIGGQHCTVGQRDARLDLLRRHQLVYAAFLRLRVQVFDRLIADRRKRMERYLRIVQHGIIAQHIV